MGNSTLKISLWLLLLVRIRVSLSFCSWKSNAFDDNCIDLLSIFAYLLLKVEWVIGYWILRNSLGPFRINILYFGKRSIEEQFYGNMGCGVILTVSDTKEQLRTQTYLLPPKPQHKKIALESKPSRVNITLDSLTQKIIKDPLQPIKIVKEDGRIDAMPLLPNQSPRQNQSTLLESGRRKNEGAKGSNQVKNQYQSVVNQNNNSTQRFKVFQRQENATSNVNTRSQQIKQNEQVQIKSKAQQKQTIKQQSKQIVVSPLQHNYKEVKPQKQQHEQKEAKKEDSIIEKIAKKDSPKGQQKNKQNYNISELKKQKRQQSFKTQDNKKRQGQSSGKKEKAKEPNQTNIKKEQNKSKLVQSTKVQRQESNRTKPPTDRNNITKEQSKSNINRPQPEESNPKKASDKKETKIAQKHYDRKDIAQTSYVSTASKKAQPAISKQSLINKPKINKPSNKKLGQMSTLFLDAEVINGNVPTQKENIVIAKQNIAQTQAAKGQVSSRPSSRQQFKTGGQMKNKNLISIRESKNMDPLLDTLENVKQTDNQLQKQFENTESKLQGNGGDKNMSSRKSLVSRKELKAAELQKDLKRIRESMQKIKQDQKKKLQKQANTLKKIYNL